jgi:catalase
MSDKHPNPHHQQAPVHGSEEAQPGLDSLAPDDREWRPTPKPTAPGAEPTAPGSLKAPDTHSKNSMPWSHSAKAEKTIR